jgi:hypothetical protein
MQSKKLSLICMVLAVTCSVATPAAEMVDVTFNVPVQIQNIHNNWSRVGVFCVGYFQDGERGVPPHPSNFQQVGVIDVSNLARQSINQTVTGTIQMSDLSNKWQCQLRLQHLGETSFAYDFRNSTEVKSLSQTLMSGDF